MSQTELFPPFPAPRAAESSDDRVRGLLRRARESPDSDHSRRIRHEVVVEHLGVARSLARRYYGRGIENDDLQQVAYLGLVKAVARCDPDLCAGFLQYAVPTVVGELKRHFRDSGWTIRPTRRIQELYALVIAARAELGQTLGHEPGTVEIAEHIGAQQPLVREAMEAAQFLQPMSLDAGIGLDVLNAAGEHPDADRERLEAITVMSPAVATLTERQKLILHYRFYDEMTQSQIGRRLGLSQMQVSRLLHDILARMRVLIGEPGAVN